MKQQLQRQLGEFKNTIQQLSRIEKVLAGMVFFIAIMIPLPGTGPMSIIMITAYVRWRQR